MATGGTKTELELLAEIARWTREAALPSVLARVERLVDTDAKKRVYEAMETGALGVKAIEKLTGVNSSKDISPWAKHWEAEGIVDTGSNPPKATFSLSELGIPPAPPKAARTVPAEEK
jgi:hypothetical protein